MEKLKTKTQRRNLIFLKSHRELVATNITAQILNGPPLSELRSIGALTGDKMGNWEMLRPQSNLAKRALVISVQESYL